MSIKKISVKLRKQFKYIEKLWESQIKKNINWKIDKSSFHKTIKGKLMQFQSRIIKILQVNISVKNLKKNAKNFLISLINKKKYNSNNYNKKENSTITKTFKPKNREVKREVKSYYKNQEIQKVKLKHEIDEPLLYKLLDYLKNHREISLNQIAKDLQLHPSTVKKVLIELEKTGRIKLKV